MSIDPVAAIMAQGPETLWSSPVQGAGQVTRVSAGTGFSQFLVDGVDGVNAQLVEADRLVQAFALDDTIPVHQVTFALEQARLSFELMLQVRNRMLEGYQQLVNMQL